MKIIYGPPGTGKTGFLLQKVEDELASGTHPGSLAYVSFTTAAVNEARSRACARFGLTKKDLPYFKTLHAIAFAETGAARRMIMNDYSEFARDTGTRLRAREGLELAFAANATPDDLLLRTHQLCAATRLPVDVIARRYGLRVAPERFESFQQKLADWKRQQEKLEYSDLLDLFIAQRRCLPVQVAFVDEAQDLTPQQWRMVEQAFAGAREIYVAGDDDQAIYHWAGADPTRMLALPGDTFVLEHSHRLPCDIKRLTSSIGTRIIQRHAKAWRAADHDGRLNLCASLHNIDLCAGLWMMLARTTYALQPFCRWLEEQGMLYRLNGTCPLTDSEIDAYRTLQALRNDASVIAPVAKRMLQYGEWADLRLRFRNSEMVHRDDLHEECLLHDEVVLSNIPSKKLAFLRRIARRDEWNVRVNVSTIHQAKGAEADHVVLSPEMSRATADALRSPAHADDEHRVWYVGVSRARKTLNVLKNAAEFNYKCNGFS